MPYVRLHFHISPSSSRAPRPGEETGTKGTMTIQCAIINGGTFREQESPEEAPGTTGGIWEGFREVAMLSGRMNRS